VSPRTRERRPVAGAPSTGLATDQGASSTLDSTPRPTPRDYTDDATLHRLALAGYRITTACRSCGAPLVDPRSVANRFGPVCGKRVVDNG